MKGMNHLEIARVVGNLSEQLEGGRIQQIFMPSPETVVFDIRTPGLSRWLLIEVGSRLSRIHKIGAKPIVPQTPPPFCMILRKHLVGGAIIEISAQPGERITALWIEKGDQRAGLIAELFGPGGNSYLVDGENEILDVQFPKKAFKRHLKRGETYKPPGSPPIKEAPQVREFLPSEEEFFAKAETALVFGTKAKAFVSAVDRQIKKSFKYVQRMKVDLGGLADSDKLRKAGELLSIHIGKIHKGQSSIELPDVYDPDGPTVLVDLDPRLSPSKNVEKYFKTASKNKRRKQGLSTRIAEMESRLDELQVLKNRIEAATELGHLDSIEQDLADNQIIPKPVSAPRKKKEEPSGPLEYVSADGVKILVGRSAAENDKLTFRIARGNDYWLHVMGRAGSHVVVVMGKKEVLKQETLLDAATLALLHSKEKAHGVGDVIYTHRKFVTKPKGAPPGQVIHSQGKTVRIRLEPARLERLVGKRQINF